MVEALLAVDKQFQKVEDLQQDTSKLVSPLTRIIHVFDREGDIAEVFDEVSQSERTGVVVRAAHDRSLDPNNAHLWEHLSNQPIQFYQEVELVATTQRQARTAN